MTILVGQDGILRPIGNRPCRDPENVKFQHTCIPGGYTVRIRHIAKFADDKMHTTRRTRGCATAERASRRAVDGPQCAIATLRQVG
jgi:hypothetical protein